MLPVMIGRSFPARCLAGILLLALAALAVPAAAGPRDRLERVNRQQERIERKLEQVRARGDELADRVAALDGHFYVSSQRGRGTTVRAVLPCE